MDTKDKSLPRLMRDSSETDGKAEIVMDYVDTVGRSNVVVNRFRKEENGKYNINWEIAKSWNGTVGDSGELIVESGKIVVSDPCYHFPDHNEWLKLLDKHDYFQTVPYGCLVLDSMGGDGSYDVNLILSKI